MAHHADVQGFIIEANVHLRFLCGWLTFVWPYLSEMLRRLQALPRIIAKHVAVEHGRYAQTCCRKNGPVSRDRVESAPHEQYPRNEAASRIQHVQKRSLASLSTVPRAVSALLLRSIGIRRVTPSAA